MLFGCEDDILIPSSDQIHCTFLECQSIWRIYVTRANSLPFGCVPAGSLDPYILLQKMPPLPQDIPRKVSQEKRFGTLHALNYPGLKMFQNIMMKGTGIQNTSMVTRRYFLSRYRSLQNIEYHLDLISDSIMGDRMVLPYLHHYGRRHFLCDFSNYQKDKYGIPSGDYHLSLPNTSSLNLETSSFTSDAPRGSSLTPTKLGLPLGVYSFQHFQLICRVQHTCISLTH